MLLKEALIFLLYQKSCINLITLTLKKALSAAERAFYVFFFGILTVI